MSNLPTNIMNTSLNKAQIQFIKELHQKEGRKSQGLYLIEGEKMIHEAISTGTQLHSFYYTSNYSLPKSIEINLGKQISEADLNRISALKTPNKVIALVKSKNNVQYTSDKIIYCSHMQDPGNAGTIIRIADWFGIKDVVFSENSVDIFSPKAVQATMGSIFRTNVHYQHDENFFDNMKAYGYKIIGADMNGASLSKYSFPAKVVVVLGSESRGIPDHIRNKVDDFVTIDRLGDAESLNVGVACGIICQKIFFN